MIDESPANGAGAVDIFCAEETSGCPGEDWHLIPATQLKSWKQKIVNGEGKYSVAECLNTKVPIFRAVAAATKTIVESLNLRRMC